MRKPGRIVIPEVLSLPNGLLQRMIIRTSPALLLTPEKLFLTATGAAVFAANLEKELIDWNIKQLLLEKGIRSDIGYEALLAGCLRKYIKPDLINAWPNPVSDIKWQTAEYDHWVICISAGPVDRDRALANYRLKIIESLNLGSGRRESRRILYLFTEFIKNTLDHTTGKALLGVEVWKSSGRIKRFVYCETGDGLCMSLRRLFSSTDGKSSKKKSFTDLVQWAFQPGNTSKPGSTRNLGMGMTLIAESSEVLGFSLSMLDASSQVFVNNLPRAPSHKQIRRRTIGTFSHPCFMYIGERVDA